MTEAIVSGLLGMIMTSWVVQDPQSEPIQHPLDPLMASEYEVVRAVLAEQEVIDEFGLYSLITLDEPTKEQVLAWESGDEAPRRAFVIVSNVDQTFEALVDISEEQLLSFDELDGAEAGILLSEEWSIATRLVLANEEWQLALAQRGVTITDEVTCAPHTAGYFGNLEEMGRRLVRVTCYRSVDADNFWGRPIEGLIALVDLRAREVVQVIDTGVVPIPDGPVDFDESSVGDLRDPPAPFSTTRPEGPSFEVSGQTIDWQKWKLHFRIDPRLGLVVSTVAYDDGGSHRSVLYQGSLSELFVPYMDPHPGWYFRTYMDAGEYGIGKLTAELIPEVDCPAGARFFDATFADDYGYPYTAERRACLFERFAGDIAWRHFESETGETEARARTDLVLRSISTIGSYDYVFDWVFRQDGSLRVDVGATGVPQVKAVAARNTNEVDEGDLAFGRMVAEQTVAVNHDHFLSFRLDLDVDGPENTFLHERLRPARLDGPTPRVSAWVLDSQPLATEQTARLRIDIENPALWRVVNPGTRGPVGHPTGFQLKPGANAVSLLSSDDYPQRRAGFTDFHLWVTQYDPRERYAAGLYPNQSRGEDGLPSWTSADRSIEDTDIVLWYTMGLHHVVRAEDWPVMPTTWGGFELRPFDFFERNPALDLPSESGAGGG